jgi:hypothetical protein
MVFALKKDEKKSEELAGFKKLKIDQQLRPCFCFSGEIPRKFYVQSKQKNSQH